MVFQIGLELYEELLQAESLKAPSRSLICVEAKFIRKDCVGDGANTIASGFGLGKKPCGIRDRPLLDNAVNRQRRANETAHNRSKKHDRWPIPAGRRIGPIVEE